MYVIAKDRPYLLTIERCCYFLYREHLREELFENVSDETKKSVCDYAAGPDSPPDMYPCNIWMLKPPLEIMARIVLRYGLVSMKDLIENHRFDFVTIAIEMKRIIYASNPAGVEPQIYHDVLMETVAQEGEEDTLRSLILSSKLTSRDKEEILSRSPDTLYKLSN